MQKPTTTKLALHTQTLRRLDPERLAYVRGGAGGETADCDDNKLISRFTLNCQ